MPAPTRKIVLRDFGDHKWNQKVVTTIRLKCVEEPPPDDPLARPVKGPCMTYTGTIANTGYGYVCCDYALTAVHRFMAAYAGADIAGKCIDHLCRNKKCCNPDHLEAISRAENVRRGKMGEQINSGQCKRCGSTSGYVRDIKEHGIDTGWRRWICNPCAAKKSAAARARKRSA